MALILPGTLDFDLTLQQAPFLLSQMQRKKIDRTWVQRIQSGTFELVDSTELREYLNGGEFDEILRQQEVLEDLMEIEDGLDRTWNNNPDDLLDENARVWC